MNRSWTVGALTLLLAVTGARAQDAGVEAGAEDDFTVRGLGGTKADPDLEVRGYSAFGTNAAAAAFVTNGPGQVFIQNNLEVGSNLYVRGAGVVFPDGSTQAAAYNTNVMVTLASGECDTNRTEILFTTNYVVSGVRCWQNAVTGQAVQIFLNGSSVTSFPFTTAATSQTLSIQLTTYDRLGILCTNFGGTVLFGFEGRRR